MPFEWVSTPSLRGCALKIGGPTRNKNLGIEVNVFLKGDAHSVVGKLDKQSGHLYPDSNGQKRYRLFRYRCGRNPSSTSVEPRLSGRQTGVRALQGFA